MNRRSFLRAFVGAPAAAAVIELLPVVAATAPAPAPMPVPAPSAPTIIFDTSAGELAFATTPEMWIAEPAGKRLMQPLSWIAEASIIVRAVYIDIPDLGRWPVTLSSPLYMATSDSMSVEGIRISRA